MVFGPADMIHFGVGIVVGGLLFWLVNEVIRLKRLLQSLERTRFSDVQNSQQTAPTSTSSISKSGNCLSTRRTCVKEPPVFDGNPSHFKEWTFAIDLALKALGLEEPNVRVDYATGYLAGNARLWLMAAMESGESYSDWPSLKDALSQAFGPHFDQERVRLNLFSIAQQSTLDSYIRDFSRLSLQVPELDEHSRAMLFSKGLAPSLRTEVLKEHPVTLQAAIKASKMAETLQTSYENWREVRPRRSRSRSPRRGNGSQDHDRGQRQPFQRLAPEDRNRLLQEGRCFACRQIGHHAKDCDRQRPNARSQ